MRQTILIMVFAGAAFGQATENLTFDVASVKPAAPPEPGRMIIGTGGGPGTSDPGRITSSNVRLKDLIVTAFDVKVYQVSGPSWLDTERYDIVAKVPSGTTKEQVKVMWQNLLKERFGLVVHHDSKEFQVEEMQVAKGGPKFKETTLDPNTPLATPPSGPPQLDKTGFLDMQGRRGMIMMMRMGPTGPSAQLVGRAQTMTELATTLGNQINKPVVDKTGLTGKYDIQVEYTPDANGMAMLPQGTEGHGPAASTDGASEPGSNLAAAVQQQLGLRLASGKAKLDTIVVDKAEKVPTEN